MYLNCPGPRLYGGSDFTAFVRPVSRDDFVKMECVEGLAGENALEYKARYKREDGVYGMYVISII